MQALTLPARRGWLWLAEGFTIFRKNPPMLALLVVGYWMLVALINLVPVIGAIIATICIPAFSVSLMNACRALDQGRPVGPQLLFSGFRENLRTLLVLGGLYLGATICILGISSLADDGILMRMMLAGTPPGEEAMASAEFLAATQLALLLLAPLVMAYWYAPVLAAWHGLPASKALFFSFVASLRNWRAFLAYSAAMIAYGAVVPGAVLGLVASLLPDGASFFAALLAMPLLMILAPTLFASFYVSYREVFIAIDENA
ncbi:MAG: hypothetical protein HY777_01460 [Betaproteobacteria bacterium]|nr:hypothetical protein [Betaproteobacteria bacterium]